MRGLLRVAVVSLWFPLSTLAAEPREQSVRLVQGTQKVLEFKGLTRVAVGDPSVLDVKVVEGFQVVLTGLKKGRTTVIVWRAGGARDDLDVSVIDPALEGMDPNGEAVPLSRVPSSVSVPPSSSTIALRVGAQRVLAIPGVQRISVGDPEVCDVKPLGDDQLLLVGGAPGHTTLLLWKVGGARVSYDVRVTR